MYNHQTDVGDGAEIEGVSNTEIQLFGVWTDVLEPVRSMKIDVLDQQRIEGVHVTNKDLVMLACTHNKHDNFNNSCRSLNRFQSFLHFVTLTFDLLT